MSNTKSFTQEEANQFWQIMPTILQNEAKERSQREKDTLVVYTACPGVREHSEGYPVALGYYNGTHVLCAANEGGYSCTMVDVADFIKYILNAP
jgi:hypothetical protein